jgi:hypothetical protein
MVSLRSMVMCLFILILGLPLTAESQPSSAPEFIPLTPCRALDTRVTGTPVPANATTTIQISGVTPGPGGDCGVPATAVGAALNFTITEAQGPGHLTVWSSGSLPVASVVNFVPGENVANAVDIGLGAGGTVLVQPLVTTHLVVDVYGYFTGGELAGSNTALGDSACLNATGSNNTCLGASALRDNTIGNNNTAVGASALLSNTMGSNNTALGASALLSSNTIGTDNTALGASALRSNTGSLNTAVGSGALINNTTGGRNTAIGEGAGRGVTTGV